MSKVHRSIGEIKSLVFHINGINFLLEKWERQKRKRKYEPIVEIIARWFNTHRAKYVLSRRMNRLEEIVRLIPQGMWKGHAELLLRAGSVAYKAERFSFGMVCYQLVLDVTSNDKFEDHETRLIAYTGNVECGIRKMFNDISHYSKVDDFGYKHVCFQHSFVWESLASVSSTVCEDLKPRLIHAKNLMYLYETRKEALILKLPPTVAHPFL